MNEKKSIRLSDETWEKLKKSRIKSKLNWETYIKVLLKEIKIN